jgi:hypothetical protein
MKTEKEKMLNGENYFACDEELISMRLRALNLCTKFNTTCDKSVTKNPPRGRTFCLSAVS